MAPRLVYIVTEDWYFTGHRLPMAQAAQAAGFEVHVGTRVEKQGEKIESLGFKLHPVTQVLLIPGSWHCVARPRQPYPGFRGANPHRRPAVAAGGLAKKSAGSCRLRPAHGRD